jgi:hypothetical protein
MTTRKWLSIWRGHEHPTWGAAWLDVGRLRLIWCVRARPGSPGHLNVWMIAWRRRLPEWDQGSYERVIRPMSKEERHRYFAAKFPRVDADVPDNLIRPCPASGSLSEADHVAEKQDVSEIAAELPALTKLARDLAYRLPGSGKPLAHIVLTREQADELLKQAAIQAFELMQPAVEMTVRDLREELQKLHKRDEG